ncbi:MAG: TetR/AcrR family transcriptional regulator [Solirubrobacterales bacterium]
MAALECFAENGYHATTTRDIASRAELSPAAVYVHFPSKGELLYSLSKVGHQAAWSTLRNAAGSEADPVARMRLMVAAFASWHARNYRLARVVLYELRGNSEDRREELVRFRRRFGEAFETEIEIGVKEGAFDVEDVPGVVLAILSLCIDVARWYSPSGPRTPTELGDLYGELILKMLGVEKSAI